MLPVEWRAHALDALEEIATYLSEHNPYAAEALVNAIEYRITSDHIAILDVLHSRREYP
ncbi:MAG: hypothetical protein ACTH3S_17985 [Marinobacter sp.]|uniref:hypothetical protein n=1 Tax=Marinobacter sp. TaxID=50741 RepID=UPI003F947708